MSQVDPASVFTSPAPADRVTAPLSRPLPPAPPTWRLPVNAPPTVFVRSRVPPPDTFKATSPLPATDTGPLSVVVPAACPFTTDWTDADVPTSFRLLG